MSVQVELSRIFIREMTDMQLIELREVGVESDARSFPIVIGLPEAFAIDRRLKGIEIPRPQTHDHPQSHAPHKNDPRRRNLLR